MNICIEAQTLNHSKRGGLMTYTEGLVSGLCRNDTKNRYSLTYYSLRRGAQDMPGPESENMKKIVLRIPDGEFPGRRFLLDKICLPTFLKKNHIEIFHRANGYTMPDCRGIFKILTVHDLRTLTIGDKTWRQNINAYRKTISSVDICVVVSECTKQDLINHFQIDEKKIRVIYLGVDKRFQIISHDHVARVMEKYKINEPYLFSVGSVPRKNIDGIIRGYAASRYAKDYLLVLGCYHDEEKYKSLAHELGVGHRVLIYPSLDNDDIVALYNGCQAFVFPSLYEGFGLPIVEAMRCGVPVITSNLSSCPEVAGDAAILVNPKNIGEITDAINQLCSNENLRKTLIQKGFERAKIFSWDQYAEEMKKIYAMG